MEPFTSFALLLILFVLYAIAVELRGIRRALEQRDDPPLNRRLGHRQHRRT